MKKQIETGASDTPFVVRVWKAKRESCLHHLVEAEEMKKIETDTGQLQRTPCEKPLSKSPSMCLLEGFNQGCTQRQSMHLVIHPIMRLTAGKGDPASSLPALTQFPLLCCSWCQGGAGIGIGVLEQGGSVSCCEASSE